MLPLTESSSLTLRSFDGDFSSKEPQKALSAIPWAFQKGIIGPSQATCLPLKMPWPVTRTSLHHHGSFTLQTLPRCPENCLKEAQLCTYTHITRLLCTAFSSHITTPQRKLKHSGNAKEGNWGEIGSRPQFWSPESTTSREGHPALLNHFLLLPLQVLYLVQLFQQVSFRVSYSRTLCWTS